MPRCPQLRACSGIATQRHGVRHRDGSVTEYSALSLRLLGPLFTTLGFLSDGVWALAAGTLGERLRRSRRFPLVQRYVSGSVFVGLGAAAAFSGPVEQS